MKRYLFFLALAFGLTSGCHAASPSFSSFYTNHFQTNELVIKANLNPSQFDTNASSITITNIGGVTGASLWTNISGTVQPIVGQNVMATGIVSKASLTASGSFLMSGLLQTNLALGNNDINPYETGTIAATGPTTTASDATIRLSTGATYQLLFVRNNTTNSAFRMRNGEPQWDDPSSVVHLNGDWATTNKGDTLFLHHNGFFWAEVGRSWANTNIVSSVVMNPTDNYLPVRESAGVFADSPWLRAATNIAATLGFTRFGITNSLPNFSTSPLVGIRSVPANPALTIDALQNGTQTPFNIYSVFTNGSSVPTMYLQTADAGTLGVFSRALQIDAYAKTENSSTNSPVIDNTVSGTVGIYANAAPSGGTNTTSIGVLGSSDPARGHWNVGVGAYVEPVTANSTSVNTAVHAKTAGKASGQTTVAGYFETEATGETAKSYLGESGVIVADARLSGLPVFVGRVSNGVPVLTIGNQGQIIFGPGSTNVLYRSGPSLIYTNDAAKFQVVGSSASGYLLAGTGTFSVMSDGTDITFGNSAKSFHMGSDKIIPNSNDIDLGASGTPFEKLWTTEINLRGLNSGADTAGITIDHDNANAIFNSFATGAGVARDFLFQSNGVTIAKFNLNSGYGGAGTKYLDDAGNYTVPGGGGGAANWSASGTTNSTLAGRASVNDVSLLTQDPTIVPLKLNTIAGHTNWLATLNSGSTNFLTVDKKGNIGIGITNIFPHKTLGITRVWDRELSNEKAWINIGGLDTWPAYNHASEWWANTGTNDGVMDLSWLSSTAIAPTKDHLWSVGAGDASTYYKFKYDGTNRYEMDVNGNVTTIGWVSLASLKLTGITKAQKTALTPVDGMVVYQTDNTPGFRGYVNGSWVMFSTVADP